MRLALAIVIAAVVAGCGLADGPVAIWTRPQPDTFCHQARVGGTLVADPKSGLAFESVDGSPNRPAWWPYGWSARRANGVIFLVDPSGKVRAREGDRILASGGNSSDPNGENVSVSVDCDIQVNPSPGA